MNVAIIEPVGGHGGMNYYDFGLAEGVANSACRVDVYTCDKTDKPLSTQFGFFPFFEKIYGGANKYLRALRFFNGLLKSLLHARKRGTSIVHLHFFHAGALERAVITLCKTFGFKVVLTVHDVESFSGGANLKETKNVFNRADEIIAHNEVSRIELVGGLGIESSKVTKIKHGNYVNSIAKVDRLSARKQLGLPEDKKILLFFGQIKSVKGLDLLLNAISELRKKNDNFLLLIAGKVWKDDFSVYQKIISDCDISGCVVQHIKYIPDAQVAAYYCASDVVVLPYKKIYQSGVLLMAMSLGCLVVASDLDGMKEVVVDGESGFLFKTGSVASLCEKLDVALNSPDAKKIAHSGRELMIGEYDWNSIGACTVALYRSLDQK